jgi:hypothetical protein
MMHSSIHIASYNDSIVGLIIALESAVMTSAACSTVKQCARLLKLSM